MKVVINVLHRATKPTGVCRYAVNLAMDISKLDNVHEIQLIIGKWQVKYFYSIFPLRTNKIKFQVIDIKNNAFARNVWFLFGLPKLVEKIKGDLLHLSFPIPVLGRLINIPTYVTVHDLYPYDIPENFGFPRVYFNRLFLYMSVKTIENIICVSMTTKKRLLYYFPKACKDKKVSVIYNTVKFSDVKECAPNFVNNRHLDSFYLCNSQHRKNKNIPLIFEAFSDLLMSRRIDSKTYLVIVGSKGPETKKLCRLAYDYRIDKNIIFTKSLTDNELAWLYKNCQIFIAASSFEGFCIPLAEAITFSTKIVCSNIPIFREIGDDNCTYFDLGKDACNNLKESILRTLSFNYINKNKNFNVNTTKNKSKFISAASKYKDIYKSSPIAHQ